MPQKYQAPIFLSRHAIERWHERVGYEKTVRIRGLIKKAIRNSMKNGMEVRNGASVIDVSPGVRAVVSPGLQGGWEVITVMSDLATNEMENEETKGEQL